MKKSLFLKNIKKCDLCGSTKLEVLINQKAPSMSSDRRILPYPLKKIKCKKCGLIFNRQIFNKKKIEENYKKTYSYNPSKGGFFFFTKLGYQERSLQIFNWIMENISKTDLAKAKNIVEVGCGQGLLLERFKKKFPKKKIIGFEFNKDAIREGRKKGLDIRDLEESTKIKADIIISFAVIEHTTSPKKFINSLTEMMNPNSTLILGQPNQDKVYYDIFFWDHFFHFSSKHIEDYGRTVNLIQIKKSRSKWPIDTFSIHFFKKAQKKNYPKFKYRDTKVCQSIEYYKKVFMKINNFLKNSQVKNGLDVLGLGEIFSLFYTYTDLKKSKIRLGIDDFPKKNNEFPFKIISLKEARRRKIGPMLCCVNRNYYNIVLEKVQKSKDDVFLPFNS